MKSSFSTQPTIAFCGTRGLPANYGGFETAVDHISRRFVDHGYSCEVFCRRSSTVNEQAGDPATGAEFHDGRQLTYVDGHPSRKLDTFVASIQTGCHLWRNRDRYHHVFWFNNANLPGILITALAGIPMSVNTDGLEWRRAKWSWPFKLYYWLSSFLIALVCRRLVSDSHGIQQYYRRRFFRKTNFIPYGAPPAHTVSDQRAGEILRRYGLEAGKYFLQITRIEPDNLPLAVAEAFQHSEPARQGYRMVFVGYKDATPYAQRLISHDGRSGVRVHEAVYDPDILHVLRSRCFCYVHGNSVGGTNPALLEAMATTRRVIAIDCIFSREVLGDCGRYFDPAEIRPTLNRALEMPDQSPMMRHRVTERYDWTAVARSYMNLAEGRPADYDPAPAVIDRGVVREAAEVMP